MAAVIAILLAIAGWVVNQVLARRANSAQHENRLLALGLTAVGGCEQPTDDAAHYRAKVIGPAHRFSGPFLGRPL